MQFKVLVVAFAASALAANGTNTTTHAPPVSTANSAGQLANAGVVGAMVAGGMALLV